MVRTCLGVSGGQACLFARGGKPAQPRPGQIRCSWCDPQLLLNATGSAGGRARLKQLLRNMPRDSQRAALRRLPEESYNDHFEAEFGARDDAEGPAVPEPAEGAGNDEIATCEDTGSMDLCSGSEAGSLERDLGELMDALYPEEQENEAGRVENLGNGPPTPETIPS